MSGVNTGKKIRARIYKSCGVEELPCVWCHRRIHKDDPTATVEHILCCAVAEHASDSLNNCKIACFACNNYRGHMTYPEIRTYTFWTYLNGVREANHHEQALLTKFLEYAKENKVKVSTQSLYSFFLAKYGPQTARVPKDFVRTVSRNHLHQHYVSEMEDLLKVKLKYE